MSIPDAVDRYQHKTRPYDHQRRYLRQSGLRDAYALLSDMGTGKTKMLLDEVAILHLDRRLDMVVITSAKGNYATWVEEIRKHLPDHIPRLVYLWDGRNNSRVRALHQEMTESRVLRFLVINIEALSAGERGRSVVWAMLGSSTRRMMIVDESTLIKGHETVRCLTTVKMGRACEFRRIATGNPTPNSPLDLWGQFEFLRGSSMGLLGCSSYYTFRARYAIMQDVHIGNGRTRQVPVAFRNLDQLSEVVGQHSFRVRKEECLDLPPKVYQMRLVELSPEQIRIYHDLARMGVAQLDSETVLTVTMVMAQLVKMHQVLCGQVLDNEGIAHEIPNRRLEALLDVVAESGKQTIVWSSYRLGARAVSRELRKAFGPESVVEFHGGVSQDDRQLAIRKFQAGDAHFFVATPHTGGRGITLTAAKTVVYYSNSFNLEHRVQSEDRAHRIGQTGSVTYVDLCAGLLDEKIIKALREKIDLSSQIMRDGYRQWVV